MVKAGKRGLFITVEGVEGVGKSSALNFLGRFLQNQQLDYVLTREPGGTEIAEAIRQIILRPHAEQMAVDTELLLMFASRAQHLARVILPNLDSGKIVISDRFTDATYAYQGGGRGIAKDRIRHLEKWVQGGLQPDLTLLLDAPIEVGLERILARGAKDRIEQEQVAFFQKVRANYLERAEEYPERFKIIDATRPMGEVHEEIGGLVLNSLDRS